MKYLASPLRQHLQSENKNTLTTPRSLSPFQASKSQWKKERLRTQGNTCTQAAQPSTQQSHTTLSMSSPRCPDQVV